MDFDKINSLLSHPNLHIDYEKELNKEQLEAVKTTEGPVLIIASAGSGKTRVLTYRLSNLIEQGVNPERILLLTFTNKAANEMVQRAKQMLDDRCSKVMACTYHSFCALMLRRYASYLGFDSDFVIHDTEDTCDTINLVKTEKGFSKEKSFPKAKELSAIFSTHVNKGYSIDEILDIDYPKYTDFSKEIHQIHKGYIEYKKEHNIFDYDDLLLQMNKLLEENDDIRKQLSDRFEYIMVDEYQDSNFLQLQLLIHLRSYENKNICVVGDDQQCFPVGTSILTTRGNINIEDVTLDTDLIVASGYGNITTKKPESIFKKIYKGKLIKITTETGKVIKATPEHIIFVKREEQIEPSLEFTMFYKKDTHRLTFQKDNYEEISNNPDLLIKKLEELENENMYRITRRQAILDKEENPYEFVPFSEVKEGYYICISHEKLRGMIIGEKVVSVEKEIYNGYVYDINVEDYRNYIAENIVVHNCIYGFRGSEFKNIINFPLQFTPCKLVILDKNYRSNQEILDLANSVTDHAKEKYDKTIKGLRYKGGKPTAVISEDSFTAAKYVLTKTIEYVESGVSLNDIAVLIRGSNDSLELEALIAQIKKNYDIEYKKYGGIKLFEKSHIKDVLAYLKVIVNPKDEISWFRIFQLYPNIGPIYARKLAKGIIENGLDELISDKHKKRKYGEYLPSLHEAMTSLLTMEFQEQLDNIINNYYYKIRKTAIDISSSTKNVKAALKKELDEQNEEAQVLLELAEGYKTASSFVTDMTLEAKSKEEPLEQLTISTIHSAKGLEFKVVFILNCIEGVFPWVKKAKSDHPEALKKVEDELEEERRVFYVAVTRAKDDLYLMCPKLTKKYGQLEPGEISRFLLEDSAINKYCKKQFI